MYPLCVVHAFQVAVVCRDGQEWRLWRMCVRAQPRLHVCTAVCVCTYVKDVHVGAAVMSRVDRDFFTLAGRSRRGRCAVRLSVVCLTRALTTFFLIVADLYLPSEQTMSLPLTEKPIKATSSDVCIRVYPAYNYGADHLYVCGLEGTRGRSGGRCMK